MHVWISVNTFWPKTQPMHIEKQQFHLGTWEILLPEKLSLNEQHQATLEQLICLNVQNFCPGGRHTRSKMHHNSISVLWWEKATELIKKREQHFNRLILLFPETPLFRRSWLATCFVNVWNASAYLNKFQVPYCNQTIDISLQSISDFKEVRAYKLKTRVRSQGAGSQGRRETRGGKTGPFKQKRSACWPSHILWGAGFGMITYLYEQPYLGNQTF